MTHENSGRCCISNSLLGLVQSLYEKKNSYCSQPYRQDFPLLNHRGGGGGGGVFSDPPISESVDAVMMPSTWVW
jgi:hypothetical protein